MLHLTTHEDCLILSSILQGGLCTQLTKRPGRTFQSNQMIYSIGAPAHSIFFLRRGLVKLSAVSKDGKEIILNVYKPDELFGEFCLCDQMRNEMAVTMEPSEIVEITFDDLLQRLQTSRDAMYTLLLSVCQRLAKAHQIICDLSFDNLPIRLAKVLLRLADDIGHATENGVELMHYITQEELAQMVAVRREVASTALGALRERGYIDYSRKGKLTINYRLLAAYVEANLDQTRALPV